MHPAAYEKAKRELAVQLRQWLSQQAKLHSIADMARSIGIVESTLRDYFLGRALPTPENLRKLRDVTQLRVLDEIVKPATSYRRARPKVGMPSDARTLLGRLATVKRSFAALSDELESLVREVGKRSQARSRDEVEQTSAGRSRAIAELMGRLKGELEFFKTGSAEDREAFRRAIPGNQLGYVVSLLKALYDEDTFREWLHFSQLDVTEKQ